MSCWRCNFRSFHQFLHFWTFRKNFSDFWLPLFSWVDKLPFTAAEMIYEGKRFYRIKNMFSIIFWLWVDDSPAFGEKKTGRVIKTAFYVCRGTIWHKTVFERKQILHFRIFSSKFSDLHLKNLAGLSNLPSTSPKEQAEGINYGEKEIIQTSFRICERRFQTFAQDFWAEPWKMLSTYAEQGFQETSIFENLSFTDFPRFWAELFGL